jgi:hypothetical protein
VESSPRLGSFTGNSIDVSTRTESNVFGDDVKDSSMAAP